MKEPGRRRHAELPRCARARRSLEPVAFAGAERALEHHERILLAQSRSVVARKRAVDRQTPARSPVTTGSCRSCTRKSPTDTPRSDLSNEAAAELAMPA